eukprot:TRINITY_DN2545_c1_g2_i1.p1 TRINITY_DN2545_c1_g2~~TRINITY_DN2545_c1_g2_i1.p1  ORF type:complete len:320 (+),score=77.62 TRINITY_DN2545_c1_g2_i1:140-1099(+)
MQFPKKREGNIEDFYTLGQALGSGAFSVVVNATSKATGQDVAIKIVSKDETDDDEMFSEIYFMSLMDHEHIVKYYEMFEGGDEYFIVLERVSGGELFDRIVEMSVYDEASAARAMNEALSAIAYMHEKDIIHRDLKPENLLLSSDAKDAFIKLADFGFTTSCEEPLDEYLGTPPYMAPELIVLEDESVEGTYGKPVDMWALGCILYILLSGMHPFQMDDDEKMIELIVTGELEWIGDSWDDVSPSAKELIERMLDPNPDTRITAEEALAHPWITQLGTDNVLNVQEQLRKFQLRKKFKGAVFSVLASQKLKRFFQINKN